MNSTNPSYMTESKLYDLLAELYGPENVQAQFRLPNKKIVDYRVSTIIDGIPAFLYVEFDGYLHYTKQKTIDRDIDAQDLAINDGCMIHIPYWLQERAIREFYFSDFGYQSNDSYPNGFIDAKCVHPLDFTINGWFRFVYEMLTIPSKYRTDVLDTMTLDEIMMFKMIKCELEGKFDDNRIVLQEYYTSGELDATTVDIDSIPGHVVYDVIGWFKYCNQKMMTENVIDRIFYSYGYTSECAIDC